MHESGSLAREHSSADLATIVLARPAGHDARSALLLAVVVAALAVVVAAVASRSQAEGTMQGAAPAAAAATAPGADGAAARARDDAGVARAVPARPGIDVAIAGMRAVPSAAGGQLVRVRVVNRGTDALGAGAGVDLLLLVDGEVAGSSPIDMLEGQGAAAWLEFPLDVCEPGRHGVTAVVDPRAAVREHDERDNASSRELAFRC